jgi:hypothetical protein
MMNWKECVRKRSSASLTYDPGNCLEGLSETAKNLNRHSVPASIRTGHLQNSNQKRHILVKLLGTFLVKI